MKFSGYFTKDESNIIKGVAILMIMFHNYFHIIPPTPGENEFQFSSLHFERFKQLVKAEPFGIIRHLLSYFGHYGVQLFVFISGYGLTISYKNKTLKYAGFIGYRIKKLYPTLILVVLTLLIIIPLYEGYVNGQTFKSLLLKLTLLHNFFPGEALAVTGPFWFFSLIVQLYLVYPFLLKALQKYGVKSLLIISMASLMVVVLLNTYFIRLDLNLNYLFIGHLSVFCLGIFLASRPGFTLSPYLIGLAAIVFLLGNEILFFWYFSFLAFSVLMLAFFMVFFKFLAHLYYARSFLVYTGRISLYLFAVHGITRFPFEILAENYDNSVITSLLSIVYICSVYGLANILKKGDAYIQKRI